MIYSDLEAKVKRKRAEVERRIGEAKSLKRQQVEAAEAASDAEAESIACEEAIAFLNSFADERQREIHERIESLVTHGLRTIFGDDSMSFKVIAEQKANRSEVSFVLHTEMGDEVVETPILDARGGGVAAVVAFLLRFIVITLRSDRQLLVVDEGFAQLSAEYEPRLSEFVRELVDKTGTQIVLITHSEAFSDHADALYRFSTKDGRTIITDLSDTSSQDKELA